MGATRHTRRTKNRFIDLFGQLGRVDLAASAAGIGRDCHYRWLKEDPKYAEAWEQAREQVQRVMEDEAFRRAVHGVDEPIYHKGELVDHVRRRSDQLLIFLLKAADPEKYRERFDVKGGEVKVVNLVQDILDSAKKARESED